MFKVSHLTGFGAGVVGAATGDKLVLEDGSGNLLLEDGFSLLLDNTDDFFSSVVLLMGFDGADAATSSPDESDSSHTMTFEGGAALDTARKKFGSASLLLDGGATDFVTTPDSADWSFGAGEFTIEAWVNWDVLPASSNAHILSQFLVSDPNRAWTIVYVQATNSLGFTYTTDGTTGTQVATNSGIDDGILVDTWHHIAVVRDSDTLRLFVGGIQTTTADMTGVTIHNPVQELVIGGLGGPSGPAGQGNDFWMDELRITKGVARYVGDFNLPEAAFPRA
jgi:hypothetical protein